VRALAECSPTRVLDLATGTGDVALEIAEQFPNARVIGLDPSERMLEIARTKIEQQGLSARVGFVGGDAQSLPFEPASFDGVTIAFGIRNVPDRARALREMARVTRPGGRVAILELSEPDGVLGPLARFHVHTVVPTLGALLSGAREYHYLQRSIAQFPKPEAFTALLESSGLVPVHVKPLTFGVCHLFVGTPRLPT
jgi:demethylmenaquinone methyltransferase/2-methoxy-6-polyprenyl-1,4-benzoquinol methylase